MAPTDLFYRLLKDYYTGDPKEEKPVISTRYAAILSILYTIFYVLPLYASATTRPSPQLSRDAPSVIRGRIQSVTLSCILCVTVTLLVMLRYSDAEPIDLLRFLGFWPIAPLDILRSLALTAVLFTGPLFEKGVVEGGWRDWIRGRHVTETLGSWMGWRNYIAGPITEEVVFRSALIPLHILAKVPAAHIVFYTPLYFGIAHVHHFYEFTLTHPYTPLLPALLRSLLQFAYTSLFGWFATFVFLRTGSLLACIVVHSFCNWADLPRFWGRVEAGVPIGPPDVDGSTGKRTGERQKAWNDGRLSIWWTVAYYVLLVAGAVGFYYELWDLTESSHALISFNSSS